MSSLTSGFNFGDGYVGKSPKAKSQSSVSAKEIEDLLYAHPRPRRLEESRQWIRAARRNHSQAYLMERTEAYAAWIQSVNQPVRYTMQSNNWFRHKMYLEDADGWAKQSRKMAEPEERQAAERAEVEDTNQNYDLMMAVIEAANKDIDRTVVLDVLFGDFARNSFIVIREKRLGAAAFIDSYNALADHLGKDRIPSYEERKAAHINRTMSVPSVAKPVVAEPVIAAVPIVTDVTNKQVSDIKERTDFDRDPPISREDLENEVVAFVGTSTISYKKLLDWVLSRWPTVDDSVYSDAFRRVLEDFIDSGEKHMRVRPNWELRMLRPHDPGKARFGPKTKWPRDLIEMKIVELMESVSMILRSDLVNLLLLQCKEAKKGTMSQAIANITHKVRIDGKTFVKLKPGAREMYVERRRLTDDFDKEQ